MIEYLYGKFLKTCRDVMGSMQKRHRDEYYHGSKRFEHTPDTEDHTKSINDNTGIIFLYGIRIL